ncbi:hypothetical protein [Nostoc sp.]
MGAIADDKRVRDRNCFHGWFSEEIETDIAFICCLTLAFVLKS